MSAIAEPAIPSQDTLPACLRQENPNGSDVPAILVREIAKGSGLGDRALVATMIRAYFDDSHDGKRERYVVCGGAFGTAGSWDKAEVAWALRTRELKEPFRSTDCESQFAQFSGWEKVDCDRLMADLVSTLIQFELGAFAAIVPAVDYKLVFPQAGECDPYYLAYADTLINMAMISEIVNVSLKEAGKRVGYSFPEEGVMFWSEQNEEVDARCGRIYRQLKTHGTWPERVRLSGRTLADKTCVPLQAADLMAREAFKYADNKGLRKVRIPVLRMKDVTTYHVWNHDLLVQLKDFGGPENIDAVLKVATSLALMPTAKPIVQGRY